MNGSREAEERAQEVSLVVHLGFDLRFCFSLALCFKSFFVVAIMD